LQERLLSQPSGLREHVPLAPWTTLGIGGPARWFLPAESLAELRAGLLWAAGEGLPVFVLGGGSNLLIADTGFPGLVLRVGLRGVEQSAAGEGAVLARVAAGEEWDPLVARFVGAGLAGVECLSGIPGSTGATPIQNVGAYGQEVAETIVAVEAIARDGGAARTFAADECGFAYRHSVWKAGERDRWVVTAVTFRLHPGGAPAVRYPELARHLEAAGNGQPNVAAVRAAVVELRRRKGMVLDPADPDTRSDGSFFVNPVIAEAAVPALLERAVALGIAAESVPRFAAADGIKLSAGWLIERAGFQKGLVHGNVGLSSKHALAIVNRGGGTAAEVVALVRRIRAGVMERFGVRLVPEPNFVGFAGDPLAE
jgi:UDP-N-acetylmuramate dehydrogenase